MIRARSCCRCRIRDRHGREQRVRVRMEWCRVEHLPRRRLHDVAEVHDRDAVRDLTNDREIMGDEQVGDPELLLEVLEQVEDLRLDRHVERGDRLVAHDQLGAQRNGPGDPDPLALAARELVRVAVVVLRVEADALHQLLDRGTHPARRRDALDLERRADDAADRVARVQRVVRILEDHLRLAANRCQRLRREPRDLLALDLDPAAGRTDEHEHRSCGRRLARPALAHQPERLARPDQPGRRRPRP